MTVLLMNSFLTSSWFSAVVIRCTSMIFFPSIGMAVDKTNSVPLAPQF